MKKISLLSITMFLIIMVLGTNLTGAEEMDVPKPKVKLTEEQMEELDEMYEELLEEHKEIIDKYVEFGVLTKQQAAKKIEWMEKRHEEMEENGFIPKCDHHHNKHKKED